MEPVLLAGGLEWKEMGISPKDMDFVEIKNSAARDIAYHLEFLHKCLEYREITHIAISLKQD